MTSGVLDDVFKLLSIAGDIEKQNRIEAATKVRCLLLHWFPVPYSFISSDSHAHLVL
jgi:hypothetical protein